MSHVLEHIEPKDLSQTVNNIYNCLSDDGLLLIEVPSDQYIISNNYTKSLEPHLSFFSIKSLEKLFGSMFDIVYCKESCGLLNTAVTQHKIEKKSIDGYWKVFTKWLLKKCDKYKKIRNTDVDNKRCFLEVFSPRYVICKIICIRRKCKRPDYFNVISSSYFSYGGSGRSVIRVVASKKILNLYKGSK